MSVGASGEGRRRGARIRFWVGRRTEDGEALAHGVVGGVDAFRRRARARMRGGEPRVRDGARRRREEDERERRAARDARARPGRGPGARGLGRGGCRARRRGAGRGGDGRVRVRASARPRRRHLRASIPHGRRPRGARSRWPRRRGAHCPASARPARRPPLRRGQTSDDSNGPPPLVSSDTSEMPPRTAARPHRRTRPEAASVDPRTRVGTWFDRSVSDKLPRRYKQDARPVFIRGDVVAPRIAFVRRDALRNTSICASMVMVRNRGAGDRRGSRSLSSRRVVSERCLPILASSRLIPLASFTFALRKTPLTAHRPAGGGGRRGTWTR